MLYLAAATAATRLDCCFCGCYYDTILQYLDSPIVCVCVCVIGRMFVFFCVVWRLSTDPSTYTRAHTGRIYLSYFRYRFHTQIRNYWIKTTTINRLPPITHNHSEITFSRTTTTTNNRLCVCVCGHFRFIIESGVVVSFEEKEKLNIIKFFSSIFFQASINKKHHNRNVVIFLLNRPRLSFVLFFFNKQY